MPEQEQPASQPVQSMLAASQLIGQIGNKPLKKKRITRISMSLPRILPPAEDEEVTTKRAALPRHILASVSQLQVEPSITSLMNDEDDYEEIEGIQEFLANQQTHLMPTSPRFNEVATREALPGHLTGRLPVSLHPLDTDQPAQEQPGQYRSEPSVLPLLLRLPPPLSRWKLSHILLVLVILVPLTIGGGVLEAAQLNQSQSDLYQVNALTGTIQWQQTPPSPLQVAHADTQGSILNIDVSKGLHQLVALDAHGTALWKTPSSRQTYSLLPTSQEDTILLALDGHITVSTPLSNSTTYLNPLVISLLQRQNGHILWHTTLVNIQQPQGAAILGTDNTYIYVALAQTQLLDQHFKPAVQLLALNQLTGQVAWRITDFSQGNTMPQDNGHLIIQKNVAIWQVAGTLNAIDTTQGRLLWSVLIAEPNLPMLSQEEPQIAIVDGNVLIERNDAIHALDLMTGDARWQISNLGLNTGNGLPVSTIATYGNTVFLYDHQTIEAIDASTQQVIWSQKQLDSIHDFNISVDGSLVYLTITDSIEGNAPAQALVALDSKNGAVRWTFQPSDQVSFISLQSSGILYNRNVLLTLFCPVLVLPSVPCIQPYLYAINPTNGAVLWKYTGNSISAVFLSNDGKTVLFQRNSSVWLDLSEHFRDS